MPSDTVSSPNPEIAHVLTLDVVGYSKLLIDQQTTLMAELNDIIRQSTRYRVADAAGKLIRLPTGDGVALVFFGEPDAAMECAFEIAAALIAHPRIQLRMGLHSGPVNRVVDLAGQPNVAGAGIDVAQRVMDCGDAGHILLSKRIAYDLAPLPKWNADLHELGSAEVKHGHKIDIVNFYNERIGNPEVPAKIKRARAAAAAEVRRALWRKRGMIAGAALLVAAGAAFAIRQYQKTFLAPGAATTSAVEKSIAVLAFVDLSQAHDQEYFCDGISEEILDALARVEGLRVVARTSSFAFKGKNLDVSEIGRKLNVATVLEGSLRRDGNMVRVTAQLVNARSGFHLWSGTIENEMSGVFEMQDRITRGIVDALKVKLALAAASPAPQNTEAYDLYLQGLFFSNKSDEPSLRKSLDLFHRALDRDPTLARAWSGIAKDWSWLADAYVRPLEGHPLCQAAARKAIEIDERDAEAHVYLGETKRILDFDVNGEIAELKRALELDPNSAEAHLFFGMCQAAIGDPAAAIAEVKNAIRLDPLSPIVSTFSVHVYLWYDRFADALAEAKRTMEIDPNYVYFEPVLALVYREEGKLNEALEIYQRLAQNQKKPSAGLAITYARLGRTDEARQTLGELVRVANTGYFPGESIASVYVALGDREAAFRWLDRAAEEHAGALHSIAVAPDFRPLHSDPRFIELVRRIGIDPGKALTTKPDAPGQ